MKRETLESPEALGPRGPIVPNWQAPAYPDHRVLSGWGCRLEPLSSDRHAADLFKAFRADTEHSTWHYLSIGPFEDEASLREWIDSKADSRDPLFYAIIDEASGRALGFASYLRIDPTAGTIEVGWLTYSPAMKQTRLATAAMALLMAHAFALGYRRYEWKCNALNAPSRRAAARLGFSYEGTFRQARVDRGRSRDTAWFSIIDGEWPAIQQAFQTWLAADNFDADGRQRQSLSQLTAPHIVARFPGDA
jgi:RimJ/RimL family protein N-acetyltransferase